MAMRTLPLEFTENDGHVDIRCAATREQNNGESCVWYWRLYRDSVQANGQAVDSAVKHAMERHMG